MLQPARDQIEIFVEALFRHATLRGYVSLRAFPEDRNSSRKAFRINPTGLSGGLKFLIDVAEDDANRAANHPEPIVFCPPIAVFANKQSAGERDLAEGLALSVECDRDPLQAKQRLEQLLGPATLVVASGGKWADPATGQVQDKLHLHWRLLEPARGDDIAKLKQARDVATRLVGGDPSNKPVCHPIRWPGSWHRKAEPVLCKIQEQDPDREIDLAPALAALTAATPQRKGNGKDTHHASAASGWVEQIQGIISGDNYHHALASLGMQLLKTGMDDGAAVNLMRSLMNSSTAPREGRWRARYDDIPRAVSTAREKIGERAGQLPERLLQSSVQFTGSFVLPDPLIQGILQRRFIYSLTGHTGRGKTAIALLFAAHVALGRRLGDLDVEKGRVVILAGENPTDAKMRWIALSQQMQFDRNEVDVHWVEGTFKISEGFDQLRREVEQLGGVDFIIIDSSAAYFESDDENSNPQQAVHARRLRALTTLLGGPCVLVLCHPPKNAGDDNLQPRGGGAYVAEIDGNLTVTKDDMAVELHWQTKLRGPDFAAVNFMLRSVTHEELKDTKGRLISTVVAEHLSDTAQEEIAKLSRFDEDLALRELARNPRASFADLASALNWYGKNGKPNRTKVQRILKRLQHDKLIKKDRGRYEFTDKGEKALKKEAQ
jgi:hypothetical protein